MATPSRRPGKGGKGTGEKRKSNRPSNEWSTTPRTHRFRLIESGGWSLADEDLSEHQSFVLKLSAAKREVWIRKRAQKAQSSKKASPAVMSASDAATQEVRVPFDHISSILLFQSLREKCYVEFHLKWRPKVNGWPEVFGGGGNVCRLYFSDDAFQRVLDDIHACPPLATKAEHVSASVAAGMVTAMDALDTPGDTPGTTVPSASTTADSGLIFGGSVLLRTVAVGTDAAPTAVEDDGKVGAIHTQLRNTTADGTTQARQLDEEYAPVGMEVEELTTELGAVHVSSHTTAWNASTDGAADRDREQTQWQSPDEMKWEESLFQRRKPQGGGVRADASAAVLSSSAAIATHEVPQPTPEPELPARPHPLDASSGQRYALLIGTNHFMDPQLSDLEYASADVMMLEATLRDAGYTVRTMHDGLDRKADSWRLPLYMNIHVQLRDFCCSPLLKPEDTLLVYVATHGVRHNNSPVLLCMDSRLSLMQQQQQPMDEASAGDSGDVNTTGGGGGGGGGGTGLGMSPQTVDQLQQQGPLDASLATAIPLSVVEGHMRRSTACRKILLLDCCYQGADVGRGHTFTPRSRHQLASAVIGSTSASIPKPLFIGHEFGEGFGVLHATTSRQRAAEADGHGLFTRALVDALSPVERAPGGAFGSDSGVPVPVPAPASASSSSASASASVVKTARCDPLGKGYATFVDVCQFVHERVKKESFLMGWELQEPTHRFVGTGDVIVVDYREKPFHI